MGGAVFVVVVLVVGWTCEAAALPLDVKGSTLKFVLTGHDQVTMLQTEAQKMLRATEPWKEYNYTCDECYRMQHSLRGYCKATATRSSEWSTAAAREEILKLCTIDTAPVSFGQSTKTREEKCSLFNQFLNELYSPMHPCVQGAISHAKAHKAVCGLLRCSGTEVPLPVVTTEPNTHPAAMIRGIADVPLTCNEYMDSVLSVCDGDQPKANDLCAQYQTNFTAQGCKEVVTRMASLAHPMRVCDAWANGLPGVQRAKYCDEILKLQPDERVRVPEYEYLLSQQPTQKEFGNASSTKTLVAMEGMGINITRATLGYGEKCSKDHTNNILLRSRAQCQWLPVCQFDNPNVINRAVLADSEPDCEGNFAIEFTCVPGGKLHRIFGPHTATYSNLLINCFTEVYQYKGPYPAASKKVRAYNPPPFNPDYDIWKNRAPKANSFNSKPIQRQIDQLHQRTRP